MSKAATRWQIMQTAAGELGYVEQGGSTGRNGNRTKFWAEHYPAWQGSAWCGAFVYWVLRKRNVEDVPLGKTGIFYTPSIVNAARAQGVWRSESSIGSARPGDLVLFDFDGSGYAKHVGFIEKYLGAGRVQTIEGNTSSTNAGSQNDGGGVYRRVRNGSTIMGWVDMSAWIALNAQDPGFAKAKPAKAKPSTSALRKTWMNKELMDHGKLSVGTVKRLQAQVNVTIDGQMGPETRKAVQKWLGVSADGVWGPKTYSAMQKKFGATQATGRWSSWLCKAMQRWLNDHRKKM